MYSNDMSGTFLQQLYLQDVMKLIPQETIVTIIRNRRISGNQSVLEQKDR